MHAYRELLLVSGAGTITLLLLLGVRLTKEWQLRNRFRIQEEAFQKIALDLHDRIGHSLSLASVYLGSFNSHAPPGDYEKIDSAVALINGSITELRHVCRSLNGDHIFSVGLIEAVKLELSQIQVLGRPDTQLQISGTVYHLADFAEVMILRIIQECLTNIIRHSDAGQVLIHLNYMEDGMELEVSDNGSGFSVLEKLSPGTASSGLKNIIKRCAFLGTSPRIASGKSGTAITIKIPGHDKRRQDKDWTG